VNNNIELTAPVGSYESLYAAIHSGANSVYLGVDEFNMRSRSSVNFKIEEISEIVNICHDNNINVYVTLNTIIYNKDINKVKNILDVLSKEKIDAVIASDFSVIIEATKRNIPVNISTQANVSNIDSVRFFAQYADSITLARELDLSQIKEITHIINETNLTGRSGKLLKIETFCHGALCMAISGRCYLSTHTYNYSANRGACLQPCRRSYILKDKEEGFEYEIDNQYILSPKDLCTIKFLDKIIESGVSILKIEGRGRSPEYVKTVVECYRTAITHIKNNSYTEDIKNSLYNKLENVYNRGFWDGYYFGAKIPEITNKYGSLSKKTKIYIGKVTNYFDKIKVAEIKVENDKIEIGNDIIVIGNKTGVEEMKITEIRVNLINTEKAIKGDTCSIPSNVTLRRNDKVYKIIEKIESQ